MNFKLGEYVYAGASFELKIRGGGAETQKASRPRGIEAPRGVWSGEGCPPTQWG